MPQISVEGLPQLGNPQAKIQIIEFSDFQCPFCKRAAFTLKASLKEFRKDIVYYFVNYPLDQSCNPGLEATLHPTACLAAKAAICANRQGKFWEYHELVFENQKRISRSLLVDLAATTRLDGPTFENCLTSSDADQILSSEIALGQKAEVRGTPSIFINGRLFRDWNKADRLRRVIEVLLHQ
jgi:protein-disulfide isomerase